MDFLENLVPILIFVIWIIISISASTRKKQSRNRQLPKREHETTYAPREERQSTQDSSSSQMSDELRRTLETIFSDKETIEEKPRMPEPEPYTVDNTTVEQKDSTPDILEEQAAIQAAFEKLQSREQTVSSSVAPQMKADGDSSDSSDFSASPDELKKGIIWAEILGKPVSLRT